MSAIDAYGEFELPEEKSEIEVIKDPVRFVSSSYDAFDVIFKKKSRQFPTSGQYSELKEALYSAGESFFAEKELKFNEAQIKKVLELLDKEKYDIFYPTYVKNGMFLSALQNTCIDKLIVDNVNHFHELGYRLKRNKWLVIGKNAMDIHAGVSEKNVGFVGYNSEGNIINNSEHIYHLGMWSECGVYLNNARSKTFGDGSKGGIFINNKHAERFGSAAKNDGVYINNNKTEVFAADEKGTAINNGYMIHESPWSNTNNIINIKKYKTHMSYAIELPRFKELSHLKQKLEDKLKEIDFTKTLNELSYEEQIKQAERFDWQKFEQDIKELAQNINEEYNKLQK